MLKILLAGTAVSLAALVFGGAALGLWLVTGGIATVSVDTDDVNLFLPVPTRLVDVGLDLALLTLPAEERRQLQRDLGDELGEDFDLAGTVRTLSRELRQLPDGDYVSVRTANERVWVGKRSGKLRVAVDAPDTRVRVAVPVRAAGRVGERLATLAVADSPLPATR